MLIKTREELEELVIPKLQKAKKAISCDTETNITQFDKDRYCIGISLCIDGDTFYIPIFADEWGHGEITQVNISGLMDNLPNVPIVFHNAKFDLKVLEKLGIKIPTENLYDTMLMAHLINEEEFSFELDDLARNYLGVRKDINLAKAMKEFKWEHVPAYVMAKYAEQDALVTYNLYFCLSQKFKEYEEVWKIDREFMLLLKEMESVGVRLDTVRTAESLKKNELWLQLFVAKLGFDPGKKKLLQEYFFDKLRLKPLTFTPKTHQPQINTNFLVKTDTPETRAFREYTEIKKRVTSYYRPYLRLAPNGRFHASYRQHGTVTGRLSCFDPNMQQIPRDSDIKGFFLPEDGSELWEIDYRTLEFRLAAVYSQQQNLLDTFKIDGDVHQLTANLLGISRQDAKITNFSIIYGAGKTALAFQLNRDEDFAEGILADFRKAYPKLFQKAKEAGMAAELNHGKIKMWSGRHRHFGSRYDYHKAFNALIQGGGFQIVKIAMLKLREHGFDMRNQVHDSVWLNIPVGEAEIKIPLAESLMSDWTEEMFGLKFSVESHRLS